MGRHKDILHNLFSISRLPGHAPAARAPARSFVGTGFAGLEPTRARGLVRLQNLTSGGARTPDSGGGKQVRETEKE